MVTVKFFRFTSLHGAQVVFEHALVIVLAIVIYAMGHGPLRAREQ